jgi:possible helicase
MSEIILSNEQISVARYSENGVIRINGGPGSGKTLVAVKRAIFLAKEYKYAEKNDKILFLFYNKSLKNTIQKLFNSDKNYEEVKGKIEIESIDSFFVKEYLNKLNEEFLTFLKSAKNNKDFKRSFEEDRKERIESILNLRKGEFKRFSSKDTEFVLSEIDWLRNCCYTKKEEYIETSRLGRGNQPKLNKTDKEEIYKILDLYRGSRERTLRYTDFYDIALLFLFYYEKEENRQKIKKYNHIIVDEAQDLSKIHFRFINLICEISKTSGNTMSLFMDKNQSIYSAQAWIYGSRTLKQVGINVNKSFILNRAYRNVKEILDVAKKLVPEMKFDEDNSNNKNKNLTLTFSVDRGIKPFYIKYSAPEDRFENLSKNIKILVDEFNYKYDDISIIALKDKNMKEIEKYLKKYSIQYIRKNKSINSNAVNITTYYSSKGTENKVIFIPNIDELSPDDLVEFYPDKTSYEILDELRKLLYIGMTRATEVLVMSSLKEETEYLKELLNTFDFQEDFINIDSDINEFYNVFNSEINKNENIEKNINKFTEIKELIQEEKIIDIAIKNELGNLKNIDNTDKNIKIEEQIEEIFPLAQKSTKIGLIKAEKLFLRADKEEEYLGTEAFEYLKSLECEIRTYYITIHEKYLKDNYSKNEKLSIILNELKDYAEFKTAVQNCIKHKVFEERNDLAHEYNEYNYDNLLKVRELVKEKLLPKFIKAFKKFNTNKEIEEFVIIGKLETEYNKIDIKRKKYYTYYITDENNNEFPALSENKYEQNKTYKLSCNKLMLKGNEYYRIVSAT